LIDISGLVLAVIAAQQSKLTIDDALTIALQNSFAVKNAASTVESNKDKVREAKGNAGPRISTNYQYLRYGTEQVANFGGQNIQFQPLDLNTWSNQLQLPIDISGVLRSSNKAAKAGVEASVNTMTAQQNDVKQNVRKAFVTVLRTKNLVEVSIQGRKNIEARLSQAQKQFAVGTIAKIDVDRLKAQVASANSDVINAENNYQISKQVLNLALSRPIETVFEVAEWKGVPTVAAEVDSLVKAGQTHRPEVKSIENTVVALGATKRFAEQGLLPSLNLAVTNQQTLDPAGINPQREINTTVIQLAIPIYDSGVARAKRRQQEQQIEQTKNNLLSLNLAISQEIRTARTNMSNAQARYRAAQEQIDLAKEVVRIARVRRDAGEGTTLEIIDAETQWVQAQNNLINSQYDYLTAYVDLQRAVGKDDIDAAIQLASKQTTQDKQEMKGGQK
jgi:outer membrane protein